MIVRLMATVATIEAAEETPVETTASIGKRQRPRKPMASPMPDVMMAYPPLAVEARTAWW